MSYVYKNDIVHIFDLLEWRKLIFFMFYDMMLETGVINKDIHEKTLSGEKPYLHDTCERQNHYCNFVFCNIAYMYE